MGLGSSSEAKRRTVMETDQSGRFSRYNVILAGPTERWNGNVKVVYEGLDRSNGKLIGWNRITVTNANIEKNGGIQNCCGEAKMLQSLNHDNIVKCYSYWVDGNYIHMITELAYSGNLTEYMNSNQLIGNITAAKIWSRQILCALKYLETVNKPKIILHCNLNCDNVFVNGNSGMIKLANFEFATEYDPKSQTVSDDHMINIQPRYFISLETRVNGILEEKLDVHSFGMCVLQMLVNQNKIYENSRIIRKSIKPDVTKTEPLLMNFLERCLASAPKRPSANTLLKHPFLAETKLSEFRYSLFNSWDETKMKIRSKANKAKLNLFAKA